jgi:hypothetical protein
MALLIMTVFGLFFNFEFFLICEADHAADETCGCRVIPLMLPALLRHSRSLGAMQFPFSGTVPQ